MGDTKVKININEGTLEIEGSQKFVEDHWDELKAYLEKTSTPQRKSETKSNQNKKPKSSGEKSKPGKKSSTITPISLDIKKTDKKPALRTMFDEKKPATDMEIVTLFAFYLKKHLKIDDIELGHASFGYTVINKKRPKNILESFKNAQRYKTWVQRGSKSNSFTITPAGEDYIDLELPLKKN